MHQPEASPFAGLLFQGYFDSSILVRNRFVLQSSFPEMNVQFNTSNMQQQNSSAGKKVYSN